MPDIKQSKRHNTANETLVCCCTDTGITLDNTDYVVSCTHVFAYRVDADAMLATLSVKAHTVEFEPAHIISGFICLAKGARLDVDF